MTQNRIAITAIKATLRIKDAAFREDAVELYFRDRLIDYRRAEGVGQRIHDSREGERYYLDLIRERYYARLQKASAGQQALLRTLEELYDASIRQFAERLQVPQ